jgi:hypothetical protein
MEDGIQNFWHIIPQRTLVLISGYARAGKDTLGDGILEWSEKNSCKINFAESLKDSANVWLDCLGLKGDFHDEQFKTANRDILVTLGEFARSIDAGVFARELADQVVHSYDDDGIPHETVICTDWRYLNELTTCQQFLIPMGWKIKTVYVETTGQKAANATELNSISEIRGLINFDQEYYFAENCRNKILAEGRMLAKQWML